jgi:outer membrane scaffolding protein for murein synthesis (MipA/OmpV family)
MWHVTDSVTAIGVLSYGRIVGPAGESPIVNGPAGRRDQFTIGSAVTYRFAW